MIVRLVLACLIFTLSARVIAAEPTTQESQSMPKNPMRLYVGTYASPTSEGIYVLTLDPMTGALSKPELAVASKQASFFSFAPSGKFVYAVNEVGTYAGRETGSVSAYAVDDATGMLSLVNSQSSEGQGPCYVSVDPKGAAVLVANYNDGVTAVLPIGADGKLEPASSVVKHEGSSVDPARQKGPHAHFIDFDPAGRFVLSADLGMDRVLVYKLDDARKQLTPNDPPAGVVPPGSGPRHVAFSRDGKFAYVSNEMFNTVTAFAYDGEKGSLTEIQTVSTLPADFKETSYAAHILVHPSGKFLYVSNRGHDSIATLAIDQASGKLTLSSTASTEGKFPRHFALDPSGNFMVVANQQSNNLVVFKVNQTDGSLTPTGSKIELGIPVCVKFR